MKISKSTIFDWFDTPFYHILYNNRDEEEAKYFMDNLLKFLNIREGSNILDLGCGRGRHSIYLNKRNYTVSGYDFSKNNIAYAKTFETEKLTFQRHNMLNPLDKKFDYIFNLFTSFSFFIDEDDDLNVVKNIKEGLNPNGVGVIDFLNTHYVCNHLKKQETVIKDTITFKINRYVENEFLYKNITFNFEKKPFFFSERIKLLELNDFKALFEKANVTLKHTFGDYKLNAFNEIHSPRLILLFQ